MLLSQRIAKDPKFISSNWRSKGLADYLIELRLKIVRSVKLLVGRELMDHDSNAGEMSKHIFGHHPSKAEEQRRYELYITYGRTPFPVMTIENDSGLLLVEQLDEFKIRVTAVMRDGLILPIGIDVTTRAGTTDVNATTFYVVPKEEMEKQCKSLTGANLDEYMKVGDSVLFSMAISALETILFLNVKNSELRQYKPTKKENEAVPKPLVPHYTYHILDIYRENRTYSSLKEIEEQVCKDNPQSQSRRAHLVRGHFKRTKTGLFWWSPFVRNSKNQHTDGIVDKDYRLNTD